MFIVRGNNPLPPALSVSECDLFTLRGMVLQFFQFALRSFLLGCCPQVLYLTAIQLMILLPEYSTRAMNYVYNSKRRDYESLISEHIGRTCT